MRASRTLATLDEVATGDHVCQMLKDGWTVNGVIDSEGASAFGAVLRTLLAQRATVRLFCHALEFLDAAGMSALADAAGRLPDRKVVLEGTNETVRLARELSGLAAPRVPW